MRRTAEAIAGVLLLATDNKNTQVCSPGVLVRDLLGNHKGCRKKGQQYPNNYYIMFVPDARVIFPGDTSPTLPQPGPGLLNEIRPLP